MAYEIRWLPIAYKQFLKLDRTIQKRISKKLDYVREDPFSSVTRPVGFNAYKLRVGDYRVILTIEKNTLVILILKVGHRHFIYKE
jgi:mRNA interferase RelE/StbE